MRLVIDADALIKLNRAGLLSSVVEAFECVVPRAVYDEVVTEGRLRGYQDVTSIEAILADRVQILSSGEPPDPNLKLGPGEQEILGLLPHLPDAVVISDDRRFLNALSVADVPSLIPAEVPGALARWTILSKREAREALELLRPVIRPTTYWDARADLESPGAEEP